MSKKSTNKTKTSATIVSGVSSSSLESITNKFRDWNYDHVVYAIVRSWCRLQKSDHPVHQIHFEVEALQKIADVIKAIMEATMDCLMEFCKPSNNYNFTQEMIVQTLCVKLCDHLHAAVMNSYQKMGNTYPNISITTQKCPDSDKSEEGTEVDNTIIAHKVQIDKSCERFRRHFKKLSTNTSRGLNLDKRRLKHGQLRLSNVKSHFESAEKVQRIKSTATLNIIEDETIGEHIPEELRNASKRNKKTEPNLPE